MAKVLIHIGLPKTATSSLQRYIFPELGQYGIRYLGVNQPRGEGNHLLYNELTAAINTGDGLEECRQLIEQAIENGESILLSEEMLTVFSHRKTWKEKTQILADILNGLDYRILITVREPTSALFSYYVECYKDFYNPAVPFIEVALKNPHMAIFQYDHLLKHIFSIFEKPRVYVVPFEKIIRNDMCGIHKFLGLSDSSLELPKLHDYNSKLSDEEFVYSGLKYNIWWVLFKRFEPLSVNHASSHPKVQKLIRSIYKRLAWISWGEVKVSKPLEDEINLLQDKLKSGNQYLSKNYGIDFK